jgi:hypothetical protein
MQEYYIRKETDEDSRGPFTLDQLSTLAEAGQLDRETYYYDIGAEQWTPISESPELVSALFPEKRRLKVKVGREDIKFINKQGDHAEAITVNEMLAAAEGRTPETSGKKDPAIKAAKAATLCIVSAGIAMALSAAGGMMNQLDAIIALDYMALLMHPLVIVGVIDLVLAVILLLQESAIYPIVRLRAALGLGFFSYLFWSYGEPLSLAAVAVASAAIFACTLVTNLALAILVSALAVLGMAGFAYVMIF